LQVQNFGSVESKGIGKIKHKKMGISNKEFWLPYSVLHPQVSSPCAAPRYIITNIYIKGEAVINDKG